MAAKDTQNALIRRGISEEMAHRLTDKYNTLKSMTDAGPSELAANVGISEDEAADIISKIGKTSSRSSSSSKAAKKEVVEDVEVEQIKPVFKKREISAGEQELLDICEERGLKAIPLSIIISIAARIKDKDVPMEKKIELVTVANRMCIDHRTSMNEPVGVVAAQSLGEPGTQMNMRTFHYAGVANINVTQGLPRLIEIVEARVASTPTMTVPLKELGEEDEGVARHISHMIEETSLNNVAEVVTDITNMSLIVTPDQNKMNDRDITIDDLVDKLRGMKALQGMVEKDDFNIIISCPEPSYQKLQDIYETVKAAKIKGIPGISRAVLSRDNNGSWVIITEGSNLKDIMKINGVDPARIKTNNIPEAASVLGIEAARNLIINEAYGTLSEAGLDVDIRHIMLVADMMTNTGFVRPLNINGIAGDKSSPLSRAAFEHIGDFIEETAFMGSEEHLEGVIENIIVGQPVTLGTGAVNLIYTPKKGDEQ